MTKRKWVTKKEILEAIKTEPLKQGNWVAYNFETRKAFKSKNCTVCAVGAVLRKAKFSNTSIDNFGMSMVCVSAVAPDTEYESSEDDERNIQSYLHAEKYLHALSYKFESQADKTGVGKKTRSILAKFVEVNFPDKIKLDPTL